MVIPIQIEKWLAPNGHVARSLGNRQFMLLACGLLHFLALRESAQDELPLSAVFIQHGASWIQTATLTSFWEARFFLD